MDTISSIAPTGLQAVTRLIPSSIIFTRLAPLPELGTGVVGSSRCLPHLKPHAAEAGRSASALDAIVCNCSICRRNCRQQLVGLAAATSVARVVSFSRCSQFHRFNYRMTAAVGQHHHRSPIRRHRVDMGHGYCG